MADFYVYGHTISEEVQSRLIEKMKQGPFQSLHIEAEANRLGIPFVNQSREPIAMRTADRIIQRQRKAGNIEFRRPNWVWVGPV